MDLQYFRILKSQDVAKLPYGLNVKEDIEHYSQDNPPLKKGWFSVERDLDDYLMIPSYREVMEAHKLLNLDSGEVSNRLGQPLPMRDLLKLALRHKWTRGDTFKPLPRLIQRPELPPVRNLVHTVFVNYVILMLLSGIGICLLLVYTRLAHTDDGKGNYFNAAVAPIYFTMGLIAVLAAGRYLFAFAYDFTPYGVAMLHLNAIRSLRDDKFG